MNLVHIILVQVPIEKIFEFARLMKKHNFAYEQILVSSVGFSQYLKKLETEAQANK